MRNPKKTDLDLACFSGSRFYFWAAILGIDFSQRSKRQIWRFVERCVEQGLYWERFKTLIRIRHSSANLDLANVTGIKILR